MPPKTPYYGFALIGGRGSGKTHSCSQYVINHVNGPPCLPGPAPHWIAIIAPTLGDATNSCFSGPSGIRALDPSAALAAPEEVLRAIDRYMGDTANFPVTRLTKPEAQSATTRLTGGAGGISIKWPNGSEAKLFGASSPDDIERLRAGGGRCLAWLEELAAWRYLDDTFDQMRFGLRQGPHPHWIASTTPKPRPLIRKIMKGELPDVVMTHAITDDNPYLPVSVKEGLKETYGDRRLGRQELYAELVDEDPDALWSRANIDNNRVKPEDVPPLNRITVGVDPSGGAGEQGIVVNGSYVRSEIVDGKRKRFADGYTLADMTCHLSPDGWGKRAVNAAVEWEADDIVCEVNFGGEMAISVIRGAAEALGVSIPVRKTVSSRGKRIRAEPVAALADRGHLHHVGTFPELEDQQCTWTDESRYSPDRLDADVFGVTHLKLVGKPLVVVGSYPAAAMSARLDR